MSKIANMLNMVNLLQDRNIHKIAELAEQLELSPRMIRQYKLELEQAGIYISSITGKYGGYLLEEEKNHIDVGLTWQDMAVIKKIEEQIKKENRENLQEEYGRIVQKLENAYEHNCKEQDKRKLEELKENHKATIEEIYMIMKKAIKQKRKVLILYDSNSSFRTNRIIHPAELFQYKQEWHVAAFCELRNEIRLFKLEAIMEYKLLSESYEKQFEIKKDI